MQRFSARNVSVTRVEQAEDAVGEQAGRGETEQHRAVGRMRELLQRAIETDRVLRVVVDRRLDREDAHQAEDDEPRDVTDDADDAAQIAVAMPLLLEPE